MKPAAKEFFCEWGSQLGEHLFIGALSIVLLVVLFSNGAIHHRPYETFIAYGILGGGLLLSAVVSYYALISQKRNAKEIIGYFNIHINDFKESYAFLTLTGTPSLFLTDTMNEAERLEIELAKREVGRSTIDEHNLLSSVSHTAVNLDYGCIVMNNVARNRRRV